MGINRMKVKSLNELASLVDKKNISDAATAAGVEAEAEDVEVVVPALERRGGAASAILPSAQQPVQQKSRAPGRGRGRARLPSQSPDAAGCVTPTKAPAGTKRWASLLSPPGATGASAASASGLSIGDERSAADELDIDYKYIQWGGSQKPKLAGVQHLVLYRQHAHHVLVVRCRSTHVTCRCGWCVLGKLSD